MTERYVIGYFREEKDLLHATGEARRRGYRVLDAFSPYPVHGLPDALGLPPSRLTWIGMWAGIIGLVLGLVLQSWTSDYDWPLIVGGQPFNSWPVFVPVSFELTVLLAGVIGVVALFMRSKLWPGRAVPILPHITDDRFALAINLVDASADTEDILSLLRASGAVEVVQGDEMALSAPLERAAGQGNSLFYRLAWAGVVLIPIVTLGGLWMARRDLTLPNIVVPTQMVDSPASRAQEPNAVFANGMTQQQPVAGTLAQNQRFFPYKSNDADRKRAGLSMTNPFRPDPESLKHGKQLYDTFCMICHGASGGGDGPVVPKFPNPPNFRSKQSLRLRDGEMFHTITLGRKKMASYASQVSWDERWKIILYIRSLQKGSLSPAPAAKPAGGTRQAIAVR
ncbi:MAG: DUF3341 domain-containing protein [Armatimonadetes bacterium]|nr:DUF3341 domain-containing protein [Armatimonadota bacterium]